MREEGNRLDTVKSTLRLGPDLVDASPERASLPESRARIRMLVETAAENGSSISLAELHDLLPSNLFPSSADLGRFIAADESLSRVLATVGDELTLRGREPLALSRAHQRALAEARVDEAGRFLARLARVCPWIELAGVSGSTAYGGAKPADDIDFFLVTQDHRLWITLLVALVYARTERVRSGRSPVYCFNRLLEREPCARAFQERRDALFAREALNLRLLHGNALYARLLESAPWMAEPFPSLYASRLARGTPRDGDLSRPRRGGRILNDLAFLLLGPYLWVMGLWRNTQLRRAGRNKECFRTVIRPGFWATESVLFDELREQYARAFV